MVNFVRCQIWRQFTAYVFIHIVNHQRLTTFLGNVQCNLASGDGEGADEFHASSTAQGQDCLALCYARSLTQKNINGMTTHPSEGCYCEIGMTKIASSNSYMSCFFGK